MEQDLVDIEQHKSVLESAPIVLEHLENKLPHSDSLNYHFLNSFSVSYFSFHPGALETLKSTGINLITNEDLRIEIVDLYTYWFEFKSCLTERLTRFYSLGTNNILGTHFVQAFDWGGGMVPLDYESLFDDHEYKFFFVEL